MAKTTADQQSFWREIAEDTAQLSAVLDLIDDAPELLGDDQAAAGLAVLELATALDRTRRVAIDRLRQLAQGGL